MLKSIRDVHLEKPSSKGIRAIWPLSSDSWGNVSPLSWRWKTASLRTPAQHGGIIRHHPRYAPVDPHCIHFGSDGQKPAER